MINRWCAMLVSIGAALAVCMMSTAVYAGPSVSEISVVAGTYGPNCGGQAGNETSFLAKSCNGRASCAYAVSTKSLGDPAPGCAKTYVAQWSCTGNGSTQVYGATLAEEASGKVIQLSCAPPPAAAAPPITYSTLIYRSRLKRWTDIPLFGTKGNDVIAVKIPAGATVKSVHIGPINDTDPNPDHDSPIGTIVKGSGIFGSAVTLKNVARTPGGVAIATHWWFDGGADAEYSISVWVTGPTSYPSEDSGTLTSANMDNQIKGQVKKWFENHEKDLLLAGLGIADACVSVCTLGTGAPAMAVLTVIAAVGGAAGATAKVFMSPGAD